jgi:hypothetical protein
MAPMKSPSPRDEIIAQPLLPNLRIKHRFFGKQPF